MWYDDDATCGMYADRMSCEAQTWLAKKEVDQNMYRMMSTFDPRKCAYARDTWDIESGLLQSQQTGLKFCYTTQAPQQQHMWESQFSILGAANTFDEWTRARTCLKGCAS